jgi:hypothetical protein
MRNELSFRNTGLTISLGTVSGNIITNVSRGNASDAAVLVGNDMMMGDGSLYGWAEC